MAHRYRDIWRFTTPSEVARVLTQVYGGAAWVEALVRLHASPASKNDTFYRDVLRILGAQNRADRKPTPLMVAEAYTQHLKVPVLEAARRACEAAGESKPSLHRFWTDVLHELRAVPRKRIDEE